MLCHGLLLLLLSPLLLMTIATVISCLITPPGRNHHSEAHATDAWHSPAHALHALHALVNHCRVGGHVDIDLLWSWRLDTLTLSDDQLLHAAFNMFQLSGCTEALQVMA